MLSIKQATLTRKNILNVGAVCLVAFMILLTGNGRSSRFNRYCTNYRIKFQVVSLQTNINYVSVFPDKVLGSLAI